MITRLCETLNHFFIPNKHVGAAITHQDAKAWYTIEKILISLAKNLAEPKQIWISYNYSESTPFITLSTSERVETDLCLEGVKNIIPKAESNGLKVEVDLEFKEITFTFTPSNY